MKSAHKILKRIEDYRNNKKLAQNMGIPAKDLIPFAIRELQWVLEGEG